MIKKGVVVITVCTMLLITAAPLFADTIPDNTSSYFKDMNITDSNNNVIGHVVYSLNVLDPYIKDIEYNRVTSVYPKTFIPYTQSNGSVLYYVSSYTQQGGTTLNAIGEITSTTSSVIYCTPVNVVCTISNYTDQFINIPQEIRTTLTITTTANGTNGGTLIDVGYDCDVGNVQSNDIFVNLYNDYVYFDFGNQFKRADANSFWLPPRSSNICSFTMYILHSYSKLDSPNGITPYIFRASNVEVRSTDITGRNLASNVSMYNDSYNINGMYNGINNIYSRLGDTNNNLSSINSNVQDIHDAYVDNQQNIAGTESQINSTQSTIDQVHQNEIQWYQANESAIQEVGLSNSSLSDNQYQGVYPVASDLSRLWSAIGPVKHITLFALMASLSAFMLRHRPFTKIGGKVQQDLDSR